MARETSIANSKQHIKLPPPLPKLSQDVQDLPGLGAFSDTDGAMISSKMMNKSKDHYQSVV